MYSRSAHGHDHDTTRKGMKFGTKVDFDVTFLKSMRYHPGNVPSCQYDFKVKYFQIYVFDNAKAIGEDKIYI